MDGDVASAEPIDRREEWKVTNAQMNVVRQNNGLSGNRIEAKTESNEVAFRVAEI